MNPIMKKAKEASLTIVTHSGTFHADESLACFMLKLLPAYSGHTIVRTRDPAVIEEGDIVVDVGGTYSPATHRYDHHQRGFEETFDAAHSTKLSSAGMVYKHFGRDILSTILSWPLAHPSLELVYGKIYDNVIEAYDGVDNGVSRYPSDITPKYKDSSSISARVSHLNPAWNEPMTDVDARFARAMALTGGEFVDRVKYIGHAWVPARDIVAKYLASRFSIHPSGRIMVLGEYCPWKEHLYELERDLNVPADQAPLYVLYEDGTAKQWRIQAVAMSPDSFESRKALPEPWRGIRDDALSTLSGVPGGVFIHASGFIGGNKTYTGALEMAKMALDH